MSKIDTIKDLITRLNKYRDSYYNRNESLISDKEYDSMFDKLIELEKETGIVFSNSPTQTVGYTSVSQLKKVKHNHPLLSLDKTTDIAEFTDYFDNHDSLVMAKLDGLTCSLLYSSGEFVRAESRGDGETGEDITHNAKVFANLPMKIPFDGDRQYAFEELATGRKIGISTAGDDQKAIDGASDFFAQNNCDVGFVASKSSGRSIDEIEARSQAIRVTPVYFWFTWAVNGSRSRNQVQIDTARILESVI